MTFKSHIRIPVNFKDNKGDNKAIVDAVAALVHYLEVHSIDVGPVEVDGKMVYNPVFHDD